MYFVAFVLKNITIIVCLLHSSKGTKKKKVSFLSQSSSNFLGKLVPYHQIKKRETEVIVSLLNVVNRCDHALEFKKNHF